MTTKDRITINLDRAEYLELQELAKEHDVSMAWLGRQAIARLLDQREKHQLQFPLDLNRPTRASN